MLASRVLYAGEREDDTNAKMRHSLKDAAERELGKACSTRTSRRPTGRAVLTPEQLAYAAADAEVLLPLAAALKAKLIAADLMGTANREFRALPGIAWAQPVTVDTKAWLAIADTAETEQARLREAMDDAAPNPACLPGAECRNWEGPASR